MGTIKLPRLNQAENAVGIGLLYGYQADAIQAVSHASIQCKRSDAMFKRLVVVAADVFFSMGYQTCLNDK